MLDQLKTYTRFYEISWFYKWIDVRTIDVTYKEKKKILLDAWYNSREADVWSYILLMNDFFQLDAEKNILWYIKENVQYIQILEQPKSAFEVLQDIIMQWLLSRQVMWSKIVSDDETEIQYTLHFSQNFFNAQSSTIRKYVDQCIAEWYDVSLGCNKVIISYSDTPPWFQDDFSEERSESAQATSEFIEKLGNYLWWRSSHGK
jgi:hypothetical protein